MEISTPANADFLWRLSAALAQGAATMALGIIPGWWLTRSLRLDCLSRLLVAMMGSFVALYAFEATAYILHAPRWAVVLACANLCVLSLAWSMRAPRDAVGGGIAWEGVLAWAALSLLALGHQFRIVVHGLPDTYWDWYEHWARARVFIDHLPLQTTFNYYTFPARGPMFNAVAALCMQMFGRTDYFCFQVVATVLNTFPVVPLILFLERIGGLTRWRAAACAVLLMAWLPFFVWNETFTWPKMFTTGFILGGIHFYCLGLAQDRPRLAAWSLVAFAAAFLAHYLAAIYAAMFLFHFVYTAGRRGWFHVRVIVPPLLAGAILVGGWFGYLFSFFGVQETLAANTTIGEFYAEKLAAASDKSTDPGKRERPAWHQVFLSNLACDFVPCRLRQVLPLGGAARPCPTFQVVEVSKSSLITEDVELGSRYPNYAGGLLGVFQWSGIAAGILALAMYILERIRGERPAPHVPGPVFWLAFFLIGIPLNIAPVRWYSPMGTFNQNLHPFVFLIIPFVVGQLRRLPAWAAYGMLALFLVDGGTVSWRLIDLQEQRLPMALNPKTGEAGQLAGSEFTTYLDYAKNYKFKLEVESVYLADRFGKRAPFAAAAAYVLGALALAVILTPRTQRRDNLDHSGLVGRSGEGPALA
jgi:hypothetical protein